MRVSGTPYHTRLAAVHAAIPGTGALDHPRENTEAAMIDLPDDELTQ